MKLHSRAGIVDCCWATIFHWNPLMLLNVAPWHNCRRIESAGGQELQDLGHRQKLPPHPARSPCWPFTPQHCQPVSINHPFLARGTSITMIIYTAARGFLSRVHFPLPANPHPLTRGPSPTTRKRCDANSQSARESDGGEWPHTCRRRPERLL